MNDDKKKTQKVVLLGDSITQGLGSKKINFTNHLQMLLGDQYTVENMALTGTTINYAETIFDKIMSVHPDYIVVLYGNVDAQIRPSRTGRIFAHIPARFQGNGMLSPRPFYSHKLGTRMLQKMENGYRFCLNRLIRKVDGTEQLVSCRDFETAYRHFVKRCEDTNLVLCSTVYIDERKFPGSLSQYMEFNDVIRKIADENNLRYMDIFSGLKEVVHEKGWNGIYCYDHFHPAEQGYVILARMICDEIKKPWFGDAGPK